MIEKIERTIRYYGLLRPPTDIENLKWWRLTADIIRPPLSTYRNDRYLQPYGFWGYVQSMYAGRVLRTYRMSYENEIIDYNMNEALFLHQSVSCHLEAMLTSFINIGLWVRPGFVLQRNNPIKDWVSLTMPPREFRIKLLTEDTVFKFTYEYEIQENCEVPESSPPPPPPPPPPPKPNPKEAGSPDAELPPISDAYDGGNDEGLTYKPEPELPDFENCTIVVVTIEITDSTGSISTTTRTAYAPVTNARATCNVDGNTFGSSIQIFAAGIVGDTECFPEPGWITIAGSSGGGGAENCFRNARIISVVEG